MKYHSVYLHIPFCRHRCAYCDFNTYAGLEDLIPSYVAALLREIRASGHTTDETIPVHTIFFGGGTPSLLPASRIDQVLRVVEDCFDLSTEVEISLEANPGGLSRAYLQDLRSAGVNRLSLGMQSANPGELAFLERQHQFEDVITAVKWARLAGFDNLSLDLIFGLPEQRLEAWEGSLDLGLNLAPEHFSLYALSLEHGTPMQQWAAQGLIPEPDSDLAAEMYEQAGERLAAAGYVQYEISNWAKSGTALPLRDPHSSTDNPPFACRHNLQYWRNQPYLGFGAGAHGFVAGYRTANVLSPPAYIRRLLDTDATPNIPPEKYSDFPRTPATVGFHRINRQTEMGETMMMGLRLTREGVSRTAFLARFDQDLLQVFGTQVNKLIDWGLLEWADREEDVLRLTPRGRLLGNRVFGEFI